MNNRPNLYDMGNQRIYRNLVFAQNAIANALEHEKVRMALESFGYDLEKLEEGLSLYEKADSLNGRQQREYNEQKASTHALTTARREADKQYMLHLKVARIALRDNPNAIISLQLKGDRKRSFAGWLEQARVFYANALGDEEILAELGNYNITREILEEVSAAIDGVEQMYSQQMKEKGDAQAATKERDQAMDALQAWMSDFKAIARLALRDQLQYLEVLGIVEPS